MTVAQSGTARRQLSWDPSSSAPELPHLMARLVVLNVWSGPAAAAAEASPGSLIDMQIRYSLNQELWAGATWVLIGPLMH